MHGAGAEVAQLEEGPDATLDGKDVAHLTDPRQVGGLIAKLDYCVQGSAKLKLRRRTLDITNKDLKKTHDEPTFHTFSKSKVTPNKIVSIFVPFCLQNYDPTRTFSIIFQPNYKAKLRIIRLSQIDGYSVLRH